MSIIRLWVDVELDRDARPEGVARDLFEFVADDPDDVLPAIETVLDYGYERLP